MGVIPSVLFCVDRIETRREAAISGFLASLIGILPGFLFYLAVLGFYPEVLDKEAPAFFVLRQTGWPFLLAAFLIVLFGTLIQTGTGFIHAFNQRLQSSLEARGRRFPAWQRPVIAIFLLFLSLGISTFGLVALVAKGYGSISWGIFLFYFVPLMTVGLARILRRD